jgi:uncharacterized protein (DUF1501 family)
MKMDRRDFISFAASAASFALSPAAFAGALGAKRLILIELRGANDGLNTVIPLKDRGYYRIRPNIAIPKKDILTISEPYGLHFSLRGISKLYEDGECTIVQNLGYPQPVLSHFRSIELWERGGDGTSNGRQGWLNAALDRISASSDLDAKAIHLDFSGTVFHGGSDGFLGPDAVGHNPAEEESRDMTVPLPPSLKLGLLGEITKLRRDNSLKVQRLQTKLKNNRGGFTVGRGSLGDQLSKICSLIAAGVQIPVLKASIGSFDTHIDQFWTHRALLRELDEGIAGAASALKKIGVWDDCLIMTYSEFGRRANENGSKGTDHGMAAPHFLLGGKVSGGWVGEENVLNSMADRNLRYSIDYRSLYDHILDQHFGISDNQFASFRRDLSPSGA